MIRASQLPRLAMCPGSHWLPQVHDTSPGAEDGSSMHEFYADVLTNGVEPALKRCRESIRSKAEAVDWSRLPATKTMVAEAPLSWNPSSFCGASRHAAADNTQWINGTPDGYGVTDDAAIVIDWKSPWQELGPVAENFQLLFYAVTVAYITGRRKVIVAIIKIRDDGTPWIDRAELDGPTLDAAAVRIAKIHAAVYQSRQEEPKHYATGAHCRYCPAFASCPAKRSLAAVIATGSLEMAVEAMTAEQVGAAWEKLKAFEDVADRAKSALRERIARGRVPASDGKVWAIVEEEKRMVDANHALAVLSDVLTPELAKSAVTLDTTVGAIDKACMDHARTTGDKGAAVKRKVWDALEACSAVRRVPIKKVKALDPERLALAIPGVRAVETKGLRVRT